jgi:hypothetical protein
VALGGAVYLWSVPVVDGRASLWKPGISGGADTEVALEVSGQVGLVMEPRRRGDLGRALAGE